MIGRVALCGSLLAAAFGCDTAAPARHAAAVSAQTEASSYGRIGTITVERAATPEAMAAAPVERSDVRVMPFDLTTATHRTVPSITVLDDRDELPLLEQRAWQARIRVIEWPSGREVAVDSRYVPPLAGSSDGGHRFDLTPREPFRDAWYAISIDMRDAGGHSIMAGLHRNGERAWVARFRPDSHPLVTGIRTESSLGGALLEVMLSERVMPPEGGEFVELTVGGRRVHCELLTQFVGPSSDDLGRLEVEGEEPLPLPPMGQTRITFQCREPIEETAALELHAGVETVFHTPVFGLDDTTPARVVWEPAEMATDGVTRALELGDAVQL